MWKKLSPCRIRTQYLLFVRPEPSEVVNWAANACVQSTLRCLVPSENGSLCGRASLTVMVRSRVVQLHLVVSEYSIQWSTKYYISAKCMHAARRTTPHTDRMSLAIDQTDFCPIFNTRVLEPPGQKSILRALSKLFVQRGLWISHHFHSKVSITDLHKIQNWGRTVDKTAHQDGSVCWQDFLLSLVIVLGLKL